MSSLRVVTSYWRKPIPTNKFDWIATYDDYEGGDGYDEPAGPTGNGATAAQAVLDLIDNHPRGVQCEQVRRCDECVHFYTAHSRDPDGSDFSVDRCRFHRGWITTAESNCAHHEFEGERDQVRTVFIPQPVTEEILF